MKNRDKHRDSTLYSQVAAATQDEINVVCVTGQLNSNQTPLLKETHF